MPETWWPSEVLRSRMPFEFRGRPIAERGVQPLRVIHSLDEPVEVLLCFIYVAVLL
jgi:hypothetical protein